MLNERKALFKMNPPPNALILFSSATCNTKTVAEVIYRRLEKENVSSTCKMVRNAADIELYEYDLVFLGSPSIQWLPTKEVQSYIRRKMELHEGRGDLKLGGAKMYMPKIPGKRAVVFCTYSGPYTGKSAAIPCVKYMAQFFEHIGFEVAGEWYVVGEFHGHQERSTKGKLGDIRGRPNKRDLRRVENKVSRLVRSIRAIPG